MLNIGLIGCGFMGRVHSNAYSQVCKFFPHEYRPALTAVSARRKDILHEFAARWGWANEETDWRRLVARDDIDVVDICTPNDTHYEIAMEAVKAGKMIICEKPLAVDTAKAKQMTEAVEKAGRPNMVLFNYRRVPAVALAKKLVDEGRLGRIFHFRAKYLQDWTIDPDLPMGGQTLWRLDKEAAGSGVTGDLLAHSIDLALWLVGPIVSVSAMTETFIKQRKLQNDPSLVQPVRIDDACAVLARFQDDVLGTFEASRYACGRKSQNIFEINGERGTIAWDMESSHLLQYYDHADNSLVRGFRQIQVWDGDHPYMKNWWVPGASIGYEHAFIHAISDFLLGLERNETLCPSFRDGYETQRVCDAILGSAQNGLWETVK
jgi:predicted dehydrogenase